MENSSISGTAMAKVNANVNNTVNTVHAQRKRMLLSEVYVHKVRKLNNNNQLQRADGATNDDRDQFDVFHIFEVADDPAIKITPKLSTNCTEPQRIIDVLRNSTGSDTPQLQRLIEKLYAQSKLLAIFCFEFCKFFNFLLVLCIIFFTCCR